MTSLSGSNLAERLVPLAPFTPKATAYLSQRQHQRDHAIPNHLDRVTPIQIGRTGTSLRPDSNGLGRMILRCVPF
ncbi:hypothetical protein [Isosphaera pallida]|uniref:hypothetical protein n=1 Tax=Isosphaera pallida TaxID=128 RepID=UPI00031BF004|nr:hypothetical protein [Isosphaera pallida]